MALNFKQKLSHQKNKEKIFNNKFKTFLFSHHTSYSHKNESIPSLLYLFITATFHRIKYPLWRHLNFSIIYYVYVKSNFWNHHRSFVRFACLIPWLLYIVYQHITNICNSIVPTVEYLMYLPKKGFIKWLFMNSKNLDCRVLKALCGHLFNKVPSFHSKLWRLVIFFFFCN